MLKTSIFAVIIALASLLGVAQEPTFPTPSVGASSTQLTQMFADYWNWRLQHAPELATQVGRHEFNDRWTDWSKSGRDRAREHRRDLLQQLLYVNAAGNLTDSMRLSANLLEWELRAALDGEEYTNLVLRVSQQSGAHTQVFSTIAAMPARTVKDYENILARLRGVPQYVDQNIALFREQLAAGIVQPEVVVDLVIDQVAGQMRPAPLSSPLLAAFTRFPAEIGPAEQDRLRNDAVAAYEQQFVPSWRRLETFLRETYRPKARPQIAVTTIPNGRAFYAQAVKLHTTTPMTPEQIHALGLEEVARIDREMEQIARADGFSGSATAYEAQLAQRREMHFRDQQEMLSYAREVLARLEPAMPRLFERLPKMPVQIRPIPPDREASTASNYEVGTTDGARPAWFNMNTYRPQDQVRYNIEALVLHETVPGHHLQTALSHEIEGLPEFRKAFSTTAFGEGWALYAESLGSELGVVYREPATRFGQLASEKFRAVRLVVDTGMHAMGWSRDRAREYFRLHVPGQSIAEIDRYIAWPGQALAYKVGQLKIRELRNRAERELGQRFDVRRFHDVVLRNGRLPLDLLEEEVARYVRATKG
jgi:prolyl oligopeptidase